jgi:polar amino acid transport system substrate-binding protein
MKKSNKLLIYLIVFIIAGIFGFCFWSYVHRTEDASLADLKNRGVLVVGSDIPYGIMEFFDENKKPVGLDVDIAREIASRLGLKLEFDDYDWDKLFTLVKEGRIDLAMSSITITPERKKEILFSDSYFNGGQAIVVRRDNEEIKGINSLISKKIAVQKDTTSYDEAKKYTSENLISTYLDFNSVDGTGIIDDLKNKKFDAIIVDYSEALNIIKNNLDLRIVGTPFTREDYGIATKIGNNSMIEKINSILEDMDNDGTLKKIEIKWATFN